MKRLKLLVWAFIFVLVGGLAWAGGASAQKSDESVSLRFAWWGGEARNRIINEICDRYEADNPGVKILREPTSGTSNAHSLKLAVQVAGNDVPDVVAVNRKWVRQYSDNGVFLDLDVPEVKSLIDLSNFSKDAVDSGIIGGKKYLVTIGLALQSMFVNTTILEELEIPLARLDNLTWSSWEDLCNEIAQKSGRRYYGAPDASFGSDEQTLVAYLQTRGRSLYTEDGKIAVAREDLAEWLGMHQRLRESGAMPAAQISSEESAKTFEQTLFVLGSEVFHFTTNNRLQIEQDLMPRAKLAVYPMPTTNGKRGEALDGAYLGISSRTKNAAVPARFIDYFINNRRSLELYKIENGFPGSSVMNEYVGTLLTGANKDSSVFYGRMLQAGGLASYVIPPGNAADVLRLLDTESQAVAFGRKTVDRAVEDFFAAYNRL
jgi:multiple sugar transport system substrate-binding protein